MPKILTADELEEDNIYWLKYYETSYVFGEARTTVVVNLLELRETTRAGYAFDAYYMGWDCSFGIKKEDIISAIKVESPYAEMEV